MKRIVSLSGGMDSATVLGFVLESEIRGFDATKVLCVGFSYGSKHNVYENRAARQIADYYHVPFRLIDLTAVFSSFKSDLLLSGGDIPEGHYESENMKQTVVPCRNMIFASILAGIAVCEEASSVWLGVHKGDHAIYPDCRYEFVKSMRHAVSHATDGDVALITPFINDTKEEILCSGMNLQTPVPYNLTRTCYKCQETACGKCGACCERRMSWQSIGKEDPIEYEYTGPLPTKE